MPIGVLAPHVLTLNGVPCPPVNISENLGAQKSPSNQYQDGYTLHYGNTYLPSLISTPQLFTHSNFIKQILPGQRCNNQTAPSNILYYLQNILVQSVDKLSMLETITGSIGCNCYWCYTYDNHFLQTFGPSSFSFFIR